MNTVPCTGIGNEFPMFPHTGTQGTIPQLHIKPRKTYILSPFTPTDIREAHLLQKLRWPLFPESGPLSPQAYLDIIHARSTSVEGTEL